MKLQEKQSVRKVFDSIANNYSNPPFFFLPSMMKRLQVAKEDILAFHGTDLEGLGNLLKVQNRRTVQISVTSGKHPNQLKYVTGGVETKGGVLVALRGTVSAAFDGDSFTGRVHGTARSVLIGRYSDFASSLFQTLPGTEIGRIEKVMNRFSLDLRAIIDTGLSKFLVPAREAITPTILEKIKDDPQYQEKMVALLPWTKKIDWDDLDDKDVLELKTEEELSSPQIKRSSVAQLNQIRNSFRTIQSGLDLSSLQIDASLFLEEKKILGSAVQKFIKHYIEETEKLLTEKPEYKNIINRYLSLEDVGEEEVVGVDELLMSDFMIEKVALKISAFVLHPDVLLDQLRKIDLGIANEVEKLWATATIAKEISSSDFEDLKEVLSSRAWNLVKDYLTKKGIEVYRIPIPSTYAQEVYSVLSDIAHDDENSAINRFGASGLY